MKTIIVYFAAILLLFSCSTTPKGVLPEKKMADVLYEMYLADACNTVKNYGANIDSTKRQSYRYILHKYDVSVAEFDSSTVWYSAHPDKQEHLYDRLTLQMQKLQKDVNVRKYKQITPVLTENDTVEVWQMPRRFDFTTGFIHNKVNFHFDRNLFHKGNGFLLTYRLKLNKEDKAEGNKFLLKVAYSGKTDSLVSYAKKDGQWRSYRVFMPLSPKTEAMTIDGWLLECKGNNMTQSAVITDVHCYRIAYATHKGGKTSRSWWQKIFSK
jgi:hypothetical protein